MKKDLTKVVFILDKSGSMAYLVDDTIGGYNSFLDDQKKDDKEIMVTTVLFNHKYEVLHDNINISNISHITRKEYFVMGTTALNDAIGNTINNVGKKLNDMNEDDRPSKVLFVIITDGEENSSVEFSKPMVKKMITHQKEKYNWEFIYLGANVDSFQEAFSLGIGLNANYTANDIGTNSVYTTMSQCVTDYKRGCDLDSSALKGIK